MWSFKRCTTEVKAYFFFPLIPDNLDIHFTSDSVPVFVLNFFAINVKRNKHLKLYLINNMFSNYCVLI